MRPELALMSKSGIVARGIARSLLSARQGDRMPTTHDFARKYGVGNGTVDAALGLLTEAGAVQIRARGRLGSFLEELDPARMWAMAGGDRVSIALPLPYSRRYEGMATALQEGFAGAGIPMTLMFIRGSVRRADAVEDGRADLAIVSRFASRAYPRLVTIHDFGDHTYVGAHGLVLAAGREPSDPTLRVAVDLSSTDQVALTRGYFGELPADRVIHVSYTQLGRIFASDAADAAIWNLDEVETHISSPIQVVPIPSISGSDTTAAVALSQRDGVGATPVVMDVLRNPALLETAQSVVRGERLPTY